MQEQKIEGEIIKARAIERLKQEQEEEKARKDKIKQIKNETMQGNAVLIELKKEQKKKDQEYEEQIKRYADNKEKI